MNRSTPLRRTPMKRAAPKPVARPARLVTPPTAPLVIVPRAIKTYPLAAFVDAPIRPQPKDGRYRSEQWRRHVAGLPCVHCGGASQAAHRNEGKALGLKTDDCLTAALCPTEHARIDQGRDLSRDERRALVDRYIVLTLRALVRTGKVMPT